MDHLDTISSEKDRFLNYIKRGRHLARTDLFFLATKILGFDKIDPAVHMPVISSLVHFRDVQGEDTVAGYPNCEYTPLRRDPVDLEAIRVQGNRRIILDPRGWFKTTINVVSHSIQIMLNFPDISIHLLHSKADIIQEIGVGQIKDKMFRNPTFRLLFPEFVPMKDGKPVSPHLIGTQSKFDLPIKKFGIAAPTMSCSSITSSSAGTHFHWLKFTDVVDEQNSYNQDQCEKIRRMVAMYNNLLISPRYFIDMEGTCYDYEDVYNHTIDREMENEKRDLPKRYKIFVRGCYFKKPPTGQTEKFEPHERDWPYLLDSVGKPISRFPKEHPTEILQLEREEDEKTFSNQKLNNPIPLAQNHPFPLNQMRWISVEALKHVPFVGGFGMSVDTAETITKRADFTAITVVGVDRRNRRYVVDAIQGKFLPDETVRLMFEMYLKWKCQYCKIEEYSFNRGLQPTMKRRMDDTNQYIRFDWVKRDNRESKSERILGMQSFFRTGDLIFSEGMNEYVKEQLKLQFSRFPTGKDDLIDSLADHFQNIAWLGDVKPKPSVEELIRKHRDHMLNNAQRYSRIYGGGYIDEESNSALLT